MRYAFFIQSHTSRSKSAFTSPSITNILDVLNVLKSEPPQHRPTRFSSFLTLQIGKEKREGRWTTLLRQGRRFSHCSCIIDVGERRLVCRRMFLLRFHWSIKLPYLPSRGLVRKRCASPAVDRIIFNHRPS